MYVNNLKRLRFSFVFFGNSEGIRAKQHVYIRVMIHYVTISIVEIIVIN